MQETAVCHLDAEMVNGAPTAHIKLVPKSKEVLQSIKQADLWISDATGTPLQQRLVTSMNGDGFAFQRAEARLSTLLKTNPFCHLRPPRERQRHWIAPPFPHCSRDVRPRNHALHHGAPRPMHVMAR